MLKKIGVMAVPILQVALILFPLFFFVVGRIDYVRLLAPAINAQNPDFSNLWFHIIFDIGNWAISLALCLPILMFIRRANKKKILNRADAYYEYPYWWFWVCSKILGYGICSLKRVPIYMQFKLVMRATFSEYHVGDYPECHEDSGNHISVNYYKAKNRSNESINIVLADTYPIDIGQLPRNVGNNYTIVIARKNIGRERTYCKKFISIISSEVRKLSKVGRVNCFATLNPCHSQIIAEDIFKQGGRGDIKSLYLYQQESSGKRNFKRRGVKIYSYK